MNIKKSNGNFLSKRDILFKIKNDIYCYWFSNSNVSKRSIFININKIMNLNKELIFNLSPIDIGEFEDLINSYYGDSDCLDLYTYCSKYNYYHTFYDNNEYFAKLNNYGVYLDRLSYKFIDLQDWKNETIFPNINKS